MCVCVCVCVYTVQAPSETDMLLAHLQMRTKPQKGQAPATQLMVGKVRIQAKTI
jgi:hypothetical protein